MKRAFPLNKVYNEDCLETMKRMPDGFVDLIVTSPPYDNLREYKGFIFDFKPIAKGLFRIIKNGGVVVWVVGDATINGSETGTSFKQALYFQRIGFNLHDTMIYDKGGSVYPASDKSNRYSSVFEYMFILSKNKPKTYNLLKDKKNKWTQRFGKGSCRQKDGSLKVQPKKRSEYGYRNNIWRINNGFGYSTKDKEAYKHPAIFPEQLADDHIVSWSNEEDIIYDPMAGSGTTLKMAKINNRKYIGSEIGEEYIPIINKRLKETVSYKPKKGQDILSKFKELQK